MLESVIQLTESVTFELSESVDFQMLIYYLPVGSRIEDGVT